MGNNDLISRSALMAEYDRVHVGPPGGARKLIEGALAVDAVEVVRCKDCKHVIKAIGLGARYCKVWSNFNGMGDGGFCNYGKRKAEPAPEEDKSCAFCEDAEDKEVCEACEITYSWERGSANVLGETNDADK